MTMKRHALDRVVTIWTWCKINSDLKIRSSVLLSTDRSAERRHATVQRAPTMTMRGRFHSDTVNSRKPRCQPLYLRRYLLYDHSCKTTRTKTIWNRHLSWRATAVSRPSILEATLRITIRKMSIRRWTVDAAAVNRQRPQSEKPTTGCGDRECWPARHRLWTARRRISVYTTTALPFVRIAAIRDLYNYDMFHVFCRRCLVSILLPSIAWISACAQYLEPRFLRFQAVVCRYCVQVLPLMWRVSDVNGCNLLACVAQLGWLQILAILWFNVAID